MKYVFFDIECACVYKSVAKICAFGYVVTDERFEVLAREDVLMNPKGKFHLTDRKGKEGLTLPYEYEDFKKYPVFRGEYAKIRALLEDKDAIVLGHATMNDVNYLNLETKRYKLPSFRFSFYDTQIFYMSAVGEYGRQFGLGVIAEELGVEFTPHRAVDDAYATMRVCRALCERENTDVSGLAERYGVRPGRIGGYKIEQGISKGQKQYLREREEEKIKRTKAHIEFFRFVNKYMNKRKKGGELDGKTFCFSRDIEDDVSVSVKLVSAIFASGGKYTSHPSECDVYIARERGGSRYDNALNQGADFIPLEKFAGALNG